jgi:hypothetical protein
MEKYKEIKTEQDFMDVCVQLKQNDATLVVLKWRQFRPLSRPSFDDAHCIQFGKALVNNTNLKQLDLKFSPIIIRS